MSNYNWELSYAGVSLPPPDGDGFSVELQPIDKEERNANGDMLLEEIALKRAVSCSWSSLKGEDASRIMSLLANNRVGTLVYYDISKGKLSSIKAYYESGVRADYFRYDDTLSKQKYHNLEISFVEL